MKGSSGDVRHLSTWPRWRSRKETDSIKICRCWSCQKWEVIWVLTVLCSLVKWMQEQRYHREFICEDFASLPNKGWNEVGWRVSSSDPDSRFPWFLWYFKSLPLWCTVLDNPTAPGLSCPGPTWGGGIGIGTEVPDWALGLQSPWRTALCYPRPTLLFLPFMASGEEQASTCFQPRLSRSCCASPAYLALAFSTSWGEHSGPATHQAHPAQFVKSLSPRP